jgi:hypothetical protein
MAAYEQQCVAEVTPASPVFITAGDLDNSGKDEAIGSFSTGLWARYNNTNWVKLHSAVPARFVTGNVDGTAGDDLIADFGSSGVWMSYNNTGWTQLTPATSQDWQPASSTETAKTKSSSISAPRDCGSA